MTTKEQQKQLQSTIWKIANEVRGAVDGWDRFCNERNINTDGKG